MKKYSTLLLLMLYIGLAMAQTGPTVIASGLNNGLHGIEIDSEGKIWISEFGTGNDDSRISVIDQEGNLSVFMTGLPSYLMQENNEIFGAYRTKHLSEDKIMIVVGEGPHEKAESILIIDKNDFSEGNPLSLDDIEMTINIGDFAINQGFTHSNLYDVELDNDGNMYLVDAASNSVFKRDHSTGELSLMATLDPFPNPLPFGPPFVDPVPTSIIKNPAGGYIIGQLTGFPFIAGEAKLYNMDAAGSLSIRENLFTSITDIAFDPTDGNLCVLQFGNFGEMDFEIGTAVAIKLYSDGSRDTIASGINGLAPSFAFDSAGNLYVTDMVFGQVLKFESTTTATAPSPVNVFSISVVPNPFETATTFNYSLEEPADIQLTIYNMIGQIIFQSPLFRAGAGQGTLEWNGRDFNNQPLSTGNYFYKIKANDQYSSGKLIFKGKP